ncbi:MAG: RNA polymerase sigma factor [Saprospirales bacterium]|nr:MAG: RNA polymerase sigma factor [Saprospirales bacterium]
MDLKTIFPELKKGNRKAQKEFFEYSSDILMGTALRYTNDMNASKDVLQEAYIRIFRSINDFEFREEEQFWGWLHLIVSREALRWMRRNKKYFLTDDFHSVSSNGVKKTPEFLFQDDLLIHLSKLPESHRIVFNLYVVEGYSHKEIMEITGISEINTRSYLSRARKKLQKLINRKIEISKGG